MRKTKASKALRELQEKQHHIEEQQRLKIEDKMKEDQLYALGSIELVTAKTIEALMLYLGIKPDDNRY